MRCFKARRNGVGLMWFLGAMIVLGAGCAPKVVIPPEPSLPPVESVIVPPVSDVILSQYEAWKGVPHRIGGMDRRGMDCSGLMVIVFRDAFSINLPRTSREQSRVGREVQPYERRPGDLAFFLDKGRDHIGVVVDDRRFLHVSSTLGVTLSAFDSYWNGRLLKVRRVIAH